MKCLTFNEMQISEENYRIPVLFIHKQVIVANQSKNTKGLQCG